MNPSQPHLQKQQSQPHPMHPQQSSQHHPQQQQQHRLSNPPSPSNPLYMSSSVSPSNRTSAPAAIPNSRAYAHGVAFLSACDSFFAGLDNFILQASTPANPNNNPTNPAASNSSGPSNATTVANEEMAITKLYQKYMQLEVETDSLSIYLAEEERKLLLELQEPQVHMSQIHSEQLKYLQAQQALQQPDMQVPSLSNKSALVRAQYEMYKKRAQMDPSGNSGTSGQVPTASTPASHNSSAQPPLSSSAGGSGNPPSSTGGAPRTPHSAPHSVPSPSSFPAGMVVLSPAQVLTPNNPATAATNAPMES